LFSRSFAGKLKEQNYSNNRVGLHLMTECDQWQSYFLQTKSSEKVWEVDGVGDNA
jgi:hypothetical protein